MQRQAAQRGWAVALTWLALVALPCASPAGAAQWLHYSEPDFDLYGDATERQIAEVVRSMQIYRLARDTVLPGFKGSDVIRPKIFVLRRRTYHRYARSARGAAGFVAGRDFAVDIVIDASRKDWTGRSSAVQHELTHHYLDNAADFAVPPWYDEGLAQYLSTLSIKRGRLHIGLPLPGQWHRLGLEFGRWMPLRQVLGATRQSHARHIATAAFYAQSWILTHYIHNAPGDDAKRVGLMLAHQDRGATIDEAIRSSFGDDFDAFESRVRSYARASLIGHQTLPAPSLPDLRGRIGRIDEARGWTELVRLVLRTREAEGSALKALIEDLAMDPSNLAAAAAQALVARSAGDWTAATAALARCAGDAADDETLVLCGDAWLAPLRRNQARPVDTGDPAHGAALRAADLYARAWRANRGNFQAANSMMLAHAVHMEGGPEIEAEVRDAIARYPRAASLRVNYAELQAANGDLAGARRSLEGVLATTNDSGVRLQVVGRLRGIENEIAAREKKADGGR